VKKSKTGNNMISANVDLDLTARFSRDSGISAIAALIGEFFEIDFLHY
jgi:hypothetical protein